MESNQDQLIVNEKPEVNLKHRYWGGGIKIANLNSKIHIVNKLQSRMMQRILQSSMSSY